MISNFFPNEVQNLTPKPTETGDLVDYAEIPGFFSNEVQNLTTKPTETGDLVDYAEIPGFLGGIVQLLALFEKKPGIVKQKQSNDRFWIIRSLSLLSTATIAFGLMMRKLSLRSVYGECHRFGKNNERIPGLDQ